MKAADGCLMKLLENDEQLLAASRKEMADSDGNNGVNKIIDGELHKELNRKLLSSFGKSADRNRA